MLSISGKNWEEVTISNRIVEKLKNDYNFSNILSKLIISRKFNQLEIDSITNNIEISNPFLRNNDFHEGSKIIHETIEAKQKILIIGDYDVDGCVSSSLLINFFKLLNKKVDFYIPNRFKDGYGASINLIKKLIKKKPNLIIMVDCGSNSTEAIDYLKSNNIKTIIFDHHDIYKPYPDIKCLVNPKKECSYNNYDYLCSSSIVYFFVDYYIKKKKLKINFDENLIYVLLATICDVMPLRNLNRLICIKVLKDLDFKRYYLFNKILSSKNIKRPLQIDDFGFLIGPIFNSSGRLNDANIVVDLMTSKNTSLQEKIINDLILINEKRKIIENNLIKEIDLNKINKIKDNVLVVSETTLNEGIIGIIASKLKEYFNKPTIVLTPSNNFYKASARSTSNFNIGKSIKSAIDKNIILKGGGHNMAAGFTIKKDKINDFRIFVNDLFKKNHNMISKKYLSKISLNAINKKFYNDIKTAGPFGAGNPNPDFLLENIKIIKPQILKEKFVSFYVKSKVGKMLPAISFGHLESELNKQLLYNKKEMNLIVQIKENLWNNKKSLQLVVLDMFVHPNKA